MALTELVIPPEQATYSVADGKEVVSTQLEGGAARYRRDILGSTSKVNATWRVGPDGYRYLRAFYRSVTVSGSLPFQIGLILDEPTITTHKAYFVSGSMQLQEQKGLSYVVGAQLEVYPAEPSEYDSDFVFIFNEFGNRWRYDEDLLNTIVNTLWPEVL